MQYVDLTNNGRSQFYINSTLQGNIFNIYTSCLEMCFNVVLPLLQLWSWNALFTAGIHCFELNESSYGPESVKLMTIQSSPRMC